MKIMNTKTPRNNPQYGIHVLIMGRRSLTVVDFGLDQVLLFFKYYDPTRSVMSYMGHYVEAIVNKLGMQPFHNCVSVSPQSCHSYC